MTVTRKHGWKILALLGLFAILGLLTQPESRIGSGNSVTVKPDGDDELDAEIYNSTWWQDYVEQVSIVYKPSNNTDWCTGILETGKYPNSTKNTRALRKKEKKPITPTKQNKLDESLLPRTGMYLVKVMKASSSTAAAVSLQIAQAVAEQKGEGHGLSSVTCPHHVHHGFAHKSRQEPSFLWTTIREPVKRSLSEYFFTTISRRQHPYNSEKFIKFLKLKRNFQLKYIYPDNTYLQLHKAKDSEIVQRIQTTLNAFHFIAVTERMDESLVVLKLLYNFPDEAMVVLSSKRAGGLDDANYDGTCHRIQKANTTADVDEYLQTGFLKHNYDFFLYAAVNRSLDKTIDMLGRERVEQEVKRHQQLEKLAEERCRKEAVFPCVQEGDPPLEGSYTSCFFGDVGCGHECVTRVVREHLESSQ